MGNINDRVVQPFYRLTVDGKNLPKWMYNMITKVVFKETDGDGANESLEINFDDPEFQVMDSNLFVEKKTSIVCEMGYINGKDYGVIFLGMVEGVENDYPKSGKVTLKITARDIGYLMSEGEKTKTWKGKTYSDIVSDICKSYGLQAITDDTSKILPRASTSTVEGKATQTQSSGSTTYTVKAGDCLWNIAKKFYGNGAQYTKIFNANRNIIKNANLIYPNQVLTIPDVGSTTVSKPTTETKTELTTVNQAGVSDLKFMQNMARKCHYNLVIDSSQKTCWFVKPEKKIKELETVGLDYKEGNEKLKSFRPKFNDYDLAMTVHSSNINIDNNEVVSTKDVKKAETPKSTGEKKEEKKSQTYTVKSGDCLWNIAKKFYGNGAQYTKIYNANKGIIKNPNLIYPGQVLTIP